MFVKKINKESIEQKLKNCYFLQNSFAALELSSLAWPLEWTA
jgi:hypothetical protein